jgi:hypothetical protein
VVAQCATHFQGVSEYESTNLHLTEFSMDLIKRKYLPKFLNSFNQYLTVTASVSSRILNIYLIIYLFTNNIMDWFQSSIHFLDIVANSYGQTGSGKTYTMEGTSDNRGLRGVIPRTVEQIFSSTENLRVKMGWNFSIECSFIEIYNEELRDLLNPNPSARGDDRLQIKHVNGRTSIPGCTVVQVTDANQVFLLLQRAANARAVAETKMNDRFTLTNLIVDFFCFRIFSRMLCIIGVCVDHN